MTHFDFAFESSDPLRQPEEPAPNCTCKEEEQQFKGIEKGISALSDREKNDLYILFLIADREGWSFWKTNQEMGYFPPDHPLIEAIDHSSRSPKQWLYFFWLQGGKSTKVEEDAQLNL